MRLIWSDEFGLGGDGRPDSSSWTMRTGNWRPGVQEYVDSAATVVASGMPAVGYLRLTATRGADGGYTSARLDTRGKREFSPPVLISASIRMPAGAEGVLPAFWTLGANPADPENWPEEGEIDIVEWQSNHPVNLGADLGRACAQTLHGPTLGAPSTPVALGNTSVLPVDLSIGFHTYQLFWLAERVTFVVDGRETLRVERADFEARGGDWTPFAGRWPRYLLFSLAVNSGLTPAATDLSPFPVEVDIDWVRVYDLG